MPNGRASETGPEAPALRNLRRLLLAIMALSMAGTGAELVLLDHMETTIQWIPLICLGVGLVALAVLALRPRRSTVRGFQVVMAGLAAAGIAGLYFHYQGNVEFELEMHPDWRGTRLIWEALTGATPALAPGTMVQFALLGLAATYRHPALRTAADDATLDNRRS